QAFIDSKKELRLLRVTDDAPRKSNSAFVVFVELASENRADVRLKTTAVEQNLQSGRNNVMLDIDPVRFVFGSQQTVAEFLEHFGQAFVEIQFRAEFF